MFKLHTTFILKHHKMYNFRVCSNRRCIFKNLLVGYETEYRVSNNAGLKKIVFPQLLFYVCFLFSFQMMHSNMKMAKAMGTTTKVMFKFNKTKQKKVMFNSFSARCSATVPSAGGGVGRGGRGGTYTMAYHGCVTADYGITWFADHGISWLCCCRPWCIIVVLLQTMAYHVGFVADYGIWWWFCCKFWHIIMVLLCADHDRNEQGDGPPEDHADHEGVWERVHQDGHVRGNE